MSNLYCLPGRAGGSPGYARTRRPTPIDCNNHKAARALAKLEVLACRSRHSNLDFGTANSNLGSGAAHSNLGSDAAHSNLGSGAAHSNLGSDAAHSNLGSGAAHSNPGLA